MKEDIYPYIYRRDDGLPDSMRRRIREDELELPEATICTIMDIFCHGDRSIPYSQRIAGACKSGPLSGGHGGRWINTYPFGVPTDQVYPEFLAVCSGRRTLKDVLGRTADQCRRMADAFGSEEPKVVTILTDKWDDPLFKRQYEDQFLRFSLEVNVLFVFWLVTDYGVTRVPFLAANRAELEDMRRKGFRLGNARGTPENGYGDPVVMRPEDARGTPEREYSGPVITRPGDAWGTPEGRYGGQGRTYPGGFSGQTGNRGLSGLGDDPWDVRNFLISIEFPYGTGGKYSYDNYEFDLGSLSCMCNQMGGPRFLTDDGNIILHFTRKAAEKFVLAVGEVSGFPGSGLTVGQAPAGVPTGSWTARLYGREFTSLDGSTGGEPVMETLRDAFDELIRSLHHGVDLHTHSTASDGMYSPWELAQRALREGVTTLAITDHDTVMGAIELMHAAPQGMTVIPGVEVSARTASGKCHILGLGCDLGHPEFVELMENAAGLRRNKLEARISYIEGLGLDIPEEEFEALRRLPSVGKPKLGDLLVKYGHAPDVGSAIRDVINKCPPVQDRVDAAVAISAIHAAGGVAIWAHPYGETGKPALTQEEFRQMLGELLRAGIRGMECWYSQYTVKQCRALETVAAQLGLLVSGGSDCHGRPGTAPVGRLNASGRKVPAEALTVLKHIRKP